MGANSLTSTVCMLEHEIVAVWKRLGSALARFSLFSSAEGREKEKEKETVESWTLGLAARREFVCQPCLRFRWEWSIRTVEYVGRIVIPRLDHIGERISIPRLGCVKAAGRARRRLCDICLQRGSG